MANAIEAVELTKSYGDVAAVGGVSFAVAEGSVFGYLGRNGSGKTTTVRMLTTLTRPTSGRALVLGLDVVQRPLVVRSRIGVTMQDAALDPQMTGLEHLVFIAGILGRDKRGATKRAREMLELFGLQDAATRTIGTYSGGMQRRLDIATALLGRPSVLFLDEPTTGLDPQSRRALWGEIRHLRDEGTTIFLTTQYLEEADQLADRLAIIDQGAIIAEGTARALKAMHGRKRISFHAEGALDELGSQLRLGPGAAITRDGARVTIEVASDIADHDVIELIAKLSAFRNGAGGLEVIESTLEDVFLRLTGHAINDPASPDGAVA